MGDDGLSVTPDGVELAAKEEARATERAGRQRFGTFGLMWFGQVVSFFGSNLTRFGLGVWVYQETGSVMQFGLVSIFAVLPETLLSPLAGALVDRWDRRWALILSDAAAAASTLGILFLFTTGDLQLWHIYALGFIGSGSSAFQWPAFNASTPLLVTKRHLGRANGMVQAGLATGQILAPLVAGSMLVSIGLDGIIFVDLLTFVAAAVLLLIIHIPRPERSAAGEEGRGSLLAESIYGWRYIKARPGLLALLVLFASVNFSGGVVQVALTPLLLSFASAVTLGAVLSFGSLGMLLGSVVMSLWGGPRRRMNGVLGFMLLGGSVLFLAGLEPSAVLIAGAAFGYLFCVPIVTGCNQAIWQSKVDPDVQGRVFATRRMVNTGVLPLAFLAGGPLADRLFEPALAADGALADSIGRLIGVGPGRGLGLMIMCVAVLWFLSLALAWRYRPLRDVETEIPDAVPD